MKPFEEDNAITEGQRLIRLAYCSVAVQPVTACLLSGILGVSRKRNADLGISGVLLCDGRMFLQVLEGPADRVDALMLDIYNDQRHHCIVELFREREPSERLYSEWRMGYGRATRDDILSCSTEAHDRLIALNEPIAANQVSLLQRIATTWVGECDPTDGPIRQVEAAAAMD
jgi:hypothetical protein